MRAIDADALIHKLEPIVEAENQIYGRGSWGFAIKCRNEVEEAPIIESERKTGKWVRVDEKPYFRKHFDRVCCSACRTEGISKWSFCPNCGADMRGEQDE